MAIAYITLDQLIKHNACTFMADQFEKHFGNKVAFTKPIVEKYMIGRAANRIFNHRIGWLTNILSAQAQRKWYREYDKLHFGSSMTRFQRKKAYLFWKIYREDQFKTKKKK